MNIGIDIGGRHIGLGIVNDKGIIVHKKIVNLSENSTNEYIFKSINKYVKEHTRDIKFIGIGVPGIVKDNKILSTCNLSLGNIDIKSHIETKIPIQMANDAVCATIAEYQYIDKKKTNNFCLITIGTGIGAGIIIEGKLYNGTNGAAGEVGHMVIERDGIKCNCGRRGCFEKYASVSKLLMDSKAENIREFFTLCDRNEKIAKSFDKYLEDLSEGIANIVNILDIEKVVIGGSLAWHSEKYIDKLEEKVNQKITNKYSRVKICGAKLGNDAGIIGAGLLNKYLAKNK